MLAQTPKKRWAQRQPVGGKLTRRTDVDLQSVVSSLCEGNTTGALSNAAFKNELSLDSGPTFEMYNYENNRREYRRTSL